ncbi:MAG TPA: histone deacetylase [Terriglobia bacterium]|nr:histone deacetylase [Terriglobia bacterium]
MKLIYSDGYYLPLGEHVFPSVKYRLVRQQLLDRELAAESDFLEPQPAADEDVLLVHEAEYVRKLKTGTLSPEELYRLEIPYSPEMVRAVWLCAGGTILAGRMALAEGVSVNLGGGFHHAFPAHGEGFCVLHDVAIAIRKLQQEGRIERAMTVDLDVHHGNGTAFIFARDRSVLTFSMHQENNYPLEKPPSDIDIHLPDGCGDDLYLHLLRQNLHHALAAFTPDILFYLAGADPYREDQLGGLSLSKEGLLERDVVVMALARERGIPVAVTLAGGYARRVEDTVDIHVGTVRAARQILENARGESCPR